MYECPNCAANLKFDIKAQMLFCEHCETLADPYSVEKNHDVEESQHFETTVYSCPQCGGKILCDDNTAATFCCYCGSSTILTSRISQFRRPKHIIPFQKTREDCKEAYREMVKGAFFAPKEFKDADALDRFRAIYMPYWLCKVEANREIEFEGTSNTQRGDYLQTHHVGFTTHLSSQFEGLMFDASTAFPDQLSSLVEPFFLSDKRPFTASYFSGFYADTNDVESRKYNNLAQNIAIEHCYKEFSEKYPNYKFEDNWGSISLKDALDVHEVEEELAMFPVWFLSYRKKDKVAYGVMNGQTGKVAVELPIDVKKFLGVALLVSIPIILLLNLFFVIKPNILLGIMIVLASILGFLVNERTNQVLDNIFYEDFQMAIKSKETEKEKQKKLDKKLDILFGYVFPFIYYNIYIILSVLLNDNFLSGIKPSYMLALIEIPILVSLVRKIMKSYRMKDVSFFNENAYKVEWRKKLGYLVKPFVIILAAIVVLLFNPVSDIIYYSAVLAGMGVVLWTMLDLISIQNKLIMRPLPQFNIRGGDEDAYKML